MTKRLTKAKAKAAIDALLAEKDSDFRAVVFELCHQLDWADDEPSFLLAIATNQLEALVRQYPERITEAMRLAMQELQQDWQRMQAQLALAAAKSAQVADQMTATLLEAQKLIDQELSRAQALLQAEREAMLRAMADERDEVWQLLAAERQAVSQQAQELAEYQKGVLEARTEALIAQAAVASRERAEQQVKQIVKGVRMKHFWETITVALLLVVSVLSVGWTGGLLLGRQPQLVSQLERLQQQASAQQVETGWLLKKANRAECFYGIKAQSDPQCQ